MRFRLIVIVLLLFLQHLNAGPQKDTTYRIAIILPFHWNDYTGQNINRSNIMLDYYNGFLVALKNYESKGLNVKLYAFDNENDTNKTKEILSRPELKTMNLIVTPIMESHLHIVNHFSSKNGIIAFSPFTAIDSLFPNNPLFYNAAPAETTKANEFYMYYRKNCPDKTLLILKSKNYWEQGFGPELLKLLETKNNIDYKVLNVEDLFKADSTFLARSKKYLVFHNTRNKKELVIVGSFMDRQKASFEMLLDYKPYILEQIALDRRIKYDMKILTADHFDETDSSWKVRKFRNEYRDQCKLEVSRYGVIGHDQGTFISEILLKYNRFNANDFTGEPFQYFSTEYLFKKDHHCNQNKGLFILRSDDEGKLSIVDYSK
ncbi:MAG: hypothetical protein H6605_10880 [Flavobacteriales bacterium]|nr:hypothetical protein [Flavobacteriales bacterium]